MQAHCVYDNDCPESTVVFPRAVWHACNTVSPGLGVCVMPRCYTQTCSGYRWNPPITHTGTQPRQIVYHQPSDKLCRPGRQLQVGGYVMSIWAMPGWFIPMWSCLGEGTEDDTTTGGMD